MDVSEIGPENLLKEPLFSEFLDILKNTLEAAMNFTKYFVNQDGVYDSIHTTADNYLKKNMEEDEAKEKAWDERKFRVKQFLRENLKLIEEALPGASDNED
jgi:hypothetical protein